MSEVLLMPFIDNTDNFCNGFETGFLWAKCVNGDNIAGQLIRNQNIEQVKLLMDHHGYQYNIKTDCDFCSTLNAEPININEVIL